VLPFFFASEISLIFYLISLDFYLQVLKIHFYEFLPQATSFPVQRCKHKNGIYRHKLAHFLVVTD